MINRLPYRNLQLPADQAVFSGAGFLLTILVARHLDAPSFGFYSACVLGAYLAVSAVGAWSISVFQVAAEKTARYTSFVFWGQLTLVAIGLVLAVGINRIGHWTDSGAPLWFCAAFVLYDFGRKFLLSLDKIAETLVMDCLIGCLLLLSFIWFQKTGSKDVRQMLALFAAAQALAVPLTLYWSKPFYLQISDIRGFARIHLNAGKWLFGTAISQWWAGNLLVVASGVYLGATALGALRLAQSLMGVLNILLQAFENRVLPQSALLLEQNFAGGLQYLSDASRKLYGLAAPVLIAVFVFAEPVMALAGGEAYAPYAFVLRGLSILYVFVLLSQPIRFMVRALHLNRYFFYGYLLNLGFALATSGRLLSGFGLYGVLIGLIAAQSILMLYWIFILQQQKNINVWKSFISY